MFITKKALEEKIDNLKHKWILPLGQKNIELENNIRVLETKIKELEYRMRKLEKSEEKRIPCKKQHHSEEKQKKIIYEILIHR